MRKIADILNTKSNTRAKNLSTEFQVYGIYLAESLNDTKHYSLYIKLAKNYNRQLLEQALIFTKGYYKAKSKGKIFMWKLKELANLAKKEMIESI